MSTAVEAESTSQPRPVDTKDCHQSKLGVNATSNDLEETVKGKLFPRDPERSMAFIRLKKREKLVSTNLKKYLVEMHARGSKQVILE
jgi:hypothetical protein